MPAPPATDRTDDELFAELLARRARAEDINRPLGELCERWRRPACFVVRRIQSSYRKGGPEDELELFHDAVRKLLDKGLDQYRGVSDEVPGRAASPKTFFLRIVKHLAIDRYRKQHEELGEAPGDDEQPEPVPGEHRAAVARGRERAEADEARDWYWAAYARLQREHPNEAAAWDLYHHQDVDDHAACAERLGISVANSYKRVSRAQAYLKMYLLELSGERP